MSDGRPSGLLEVGRFGRPHGVKGRIHLRLSSDRDERAQVGARLWSGEWFDVVSSSARPEGGHFIVALRGVDDRPGAEGLVNRTVWAEPVEDVDAVWVHHVIGAEVIDETGVRRGRCVSVVANPANDLLELESGALVPTVFVSSVRPDGRGGYVVIIDPPDGLFEVFEDDESVEREATRGS